MFYWLLLIFYKGTNDLGKGESVETIYSNLQQITNIALNDDTLADAVLNIGIPDSAFLKRESRVKLKRDQINDMLSARMNNKLHYISCPIKYEIGSKNFESDGLHFSERGYAELAKSLSITVNSLLS